MNGRPTAGERPYRAWTPHGPAEITFVAAALDIPLPDNKAMGSRLALRSTTVGLPDAYAVFERVNGPDAEWRKVTPNLSLAALDDWRAHRRVIGGRLAGPFQRWLDNVLHNQRRAGRSCDAFE